MRMAVVPTVSLAVLTSKPIFSMFEFLEVSLNEKVKVSEKS